VVVSLGFALVLALTSGVLSSVYGFFPSIGGLSSTATSWLFGTLGGAMIAASLVGAWRMFARTFHEESSGIRFANAVLLGLGMSLVGTVLYFAISAALPSGNGRDVARGIALAGSALLGLRIGYSLDRPVWLASWMGGRRRGSGSRSQAVRPKLLDTSVIIDGRIGDLVATGFLEGPILIPEFVLVELQAIADSSNSVRRRKGRRGLEILSRLSCDGDSDVRISSKDYPDIREVDRKLIRLAQEESATLLTIDSNLIRVAHVEGIEILNIHALARAVRPRFIPGEGLSLGVVDRGEETDQGIGYLDDGTMVVVENGRQHIGQKIRATVKTTLQTEAGRMLFVEPVSHASGWER